jgi:phage terminase large subunit
MTPNANVRVPAKLLPIFKPARYKAAYGGRGSGKSHTFATALILRCFERPTRAVCIREVQNTIKESVRQLLIDKITEYGLAEHFDVLEAEIRGKNGSLIIFRGMQSYNAANIKSLEGYDLCWIEEAQTLSAISWRLLRPTIRKDGSEIWCTWNPRHDSDAVDTFFRGPHPPKDSIVIEANWRDNPWFNGTLREEMDRDRNADPEMAGHVWDGGYEIVSEGAYYARLIARAEQEGRIGDFPYRSGRKLQSSWDLGIEDHTCIWFWDEEIDKVTVVDYYEASGDGFDEIVATCMPELFTPPSLNAKFFDWSRDRALFEAGRSQPYVYADHWLPHDVGVREQANGGRERYKTLRELGLKTIRRGTATNPEDRINAGRRLLPLLRFNQTPRVMKGLQRLRRYKRKFNEALGEYQGPLHDENSHGADAFGEFAINCPLVKIHEELAAITPSKGVLRANEDGSTSLNISEIAEIMDMRERQGGRIPIR